MVGGCGLLTAFCPHTYPFSQHKHTRSSRTWIVPRGEIFKRSSSVPRAISFLMTIQSFPAVASGTSLGVFVIECWTRTSIAFVKSKKKQLRRRILVSRFWTLLTLVYRDVRSCKPKRKGPMLCPELPSRPLRSETLALSNRAYNRRRSGTEPPGRRHKRNGPLCTLPVLVVGLHTMSVFARRRMALA